MERTERFEKQNLLDLPILRLRAIDWALVLFGLIVAGAVLTRFWDLGSRALHHDESLHAVFSHYLYNGQGYQHDPLMHGPFLFHVTALVFWLFGDSDFTVRVAPAIFGVAIVAFPWLIRKWIGVRGALIASFLALISPSILYYSRFIRHDVFALLWTLIIVYGVFQYLDDGRNRWLAVTGAGLALMYSTKEISFLFSIVVWVFLAVVVAYQLFKAGMDAVRDSRAWHLIVLIGALLAPLATAFIVEVILGNLGGLGWDALDYSAAGIARSGAIFAVLFAVGVGAVYLLSDLSKFTVMASVFYTIYILLHTTFLTNGQGVASGFVGALGYWIDQHGVRRGEQPWFYYILLLWLYEYLPLLIGLFGGGTLLVLGRNGDSIEDDGRIRVNGLFPMFLMWWLTVSFVLYSWAGEKMPWLSVHMALPAIWLAAWTLGYVFDRFSWDTLRERNGVWFALAFTGACVAGLMLFYLAFSGQFPLQGTDLESLNVTARWLAALIVLVAAGWAAWRLMQELGSDAAGDAAILVIFALLAVMTVRHAWLASYVHGDIAREMLIYTQSSPDVTMVDEDLRAISKRLTGGLDMVVAYDNEVSWPFEWYLRHFSNKKFYGENPTADIADAPVVLVGLANEQKVKQFIPDYIRHQYKLRWWFPEEYKDLINSDRGYRTAIDEIQDPESRRLFLDFFLWRKLRDPLGSTDFVMYVRPDLVEEVWQYGNLVQAIDPSLAEDPYEEQQVTLQPSNILSAGTDVQFSSPKAVAVGPDGQMAVADSGNNRIILFDAAGNLQTTIGGEQGTQPGQFSEPWGVAIGPEGNIYVADTWNHRVQKFDSDGNPMNAWGTFADTQGTLEQPATFWGPRGIAVGDDGRVYVADTGNKRVQVFESDGTFVEMFGGAGSELGQMLEPTGVTVGSDGAIYVADTWNRRVQVFTPEFEYEREWSIRGWRGESVVNKPSITTDGSHVWVTDPEVHRVIEFDTEGEVQRVWGNFGTEPAAFNLPLGVSVDAGRLLVADSENQRVKTYDLQ